MVEVTRFFREKKLTLRSLRGREVVVQADYFELFVLYELVRRCRGALPRQTRQVDGKQVFFVALSPSPKWGNASYFEVRRNGDATRLVGMRTGLSVLCRARGTTAELDVVAVDAPGQSSDDVDTTQVLFGLECKAHRGKITTTIADGVLGKAQRIWDLPVPGVMGGRGVGSFAVASCSDAHPNAKQNLAHERIAFLWWLDASKPLEGHLERVVKALGM